MGFHQDWRCSKKHLGVSFDLACIYGSRYRRERKKQNGMDEHVIFFLVINSKAGVLNKIIPGVQLGSTIKKKLGDFGDRTWRFEQESGFEFELFEPSKLDLPKRNPDVKIGEISAKLTTNQSTLCPKGPHWRSHPPSTGPQFLAEHSWSLVVWSSVVQNQYKK
jgi:hypothetical protein